LANLVACNRQVSRWQTISRERRRPKRQQSTATPDFDPCGDNPERHEGPRLDGYPFKTGRPGQRQSRARPLVKIGGETCQEWTVEFSHPDPNALNLLRLECSHEHPDAYTQCRSGQRLKQRERLTVQELDCSIPSGSLTVYFKLPPKFSVRMVRLSAV
jgi:hypothetical protein